MDDPGHIPSPARPRRVILHVDMDAFFASIEQRDHPELRGRPVLVGGSGPRGVVAAASYEARAFGCRSAMPTAVARRLCPHAVVVKGRHADYAAVSRAVFAILERATPLVQPISIDEAFCDVTGSLRLLGPPVGIARAVRADIRAETGLTASVGVAPNKFLAKLASDLDKPDGLTIVRPDRIHQTLDPLPIARLWGVGPAAERALHALGIRTIGRLRAVDRPVLRARFGDFGDHLWRLARGIDDRPVHTDREAKSISHERTFGVDLSSLDEVRAVLLGEAEAVARRLRRHGRHAGTVTVKIRFGDFQTITRSTTLPAPTDRTDVIADAARALLDRWAVRFQPVRLIGVGVEQLTATPGDAGLFAQDEHAKRRAVDRAADAIAERFGKGAITLGGTLERSKRRSDEGS